MCSASSVMYDDDYASAVAVAVMVVRCHLKSCVSAETSSSTMSSRGSIMRH
jgi:hypothetical protein